MKFNTIFSEFPVIETEKYILRKLRVEDAEDLYDYYSDREVSKYLDWYGPDSVEDAKEVIDIWNRGYDEGWILRWAIVSKKENKIIGTIYYGSFEGNLRAEIGYELSRKHWRQGVMSEVMDSFIQFGVEKFGLQRIQAIVNPENIASQALLKKFGFEEEGLLRKYEYHIVDKKLTDMIMFALVR